LGCERHPYLFEIHLVQRIVSPIHQLKPDANAKQATKDAEQQAKDDLKGIGQ
jgi:hypothetical protein